MASGPCISPCIGKYVGLWKAQEYSDAQVDLVQQTAEGAGICAEDVKVLRQFPAHRRALREGSTYFKGLMTTGEELAATAASINIERRPCAHGFETIVIPCSSSEEADAMENVIMFMYTNSLPADVSLPTLVKMIRAADYLGSEQCLTACIQAYINHARADAFMLEHASQLVAVVKRQPQPSDVEQKLYKLCVESINYHAPKLLWAVAGSPLEVHIKSTLLECFGNVRDVVQNQELYAPFCGLSLDAIALWGKSSALQVDSENSIVVLLSGWWAKQAEAVKTPECKQHLSALVRLPLLNYSYLHYVMDSLEWFEPPSPDYKTACTFIQQLRGDYSEELQSYSKMSKPGRSYCQKKQCILQWRVPLKALQELVENGASTFSPDAYWQGIAFSFCLSRSEKHKCIELLFSFQNPCMEAMATDTLKSVGLELQVDSTVVHQKPTKVVVPVGEDELFWVLSFPQFQVTDLATELAGKLEPDNSLLITATVRKVF